MKGAVNLIPSHIEGAKNVLWGYIEGSIVTLNNAVVATQDFLYTHITEGLAQLQISTQGFIGGAQEYLGGAINTGNALLSGMIESGQTVLMTAFDGMGNAISGIMGGIFSGFGIVDTDALVGAHVSVRGILETTIKTFGLTHSPITPSEAAAFTPSFITQVTSA
ncbi:unnamed protein product, partial [marine sediment metagenome]